MTQLPLADWRDFYLTIGTASGVITGAVFVVATLAAGLKEKTAIGMRGFITPTAVHLGSVLLTSVILTVPNLDQIALVILLAAGGLGGVIYSIVVGHRIRALNLSVDDRLFYMLLPVLAYGAMVVAALAAFGFTALCFDLIAAALVLLLMIGMRNAWDMANFMITRDPS